MVVSSKSWKDIESKLKQWYSDCEHVHNIYLAGLEELGPAKKEIEILAEKRSAIPNQFRAAVRAWAQNQVGDYGQLDDLIKRLDTKLNRSLGTRRGMGYRDYCSEFQFHPNYSVDGFKDSEGKVLKSYKYVISVHISDDIFGIPPGEEPVQEEGETTQKFKARLKNYDTLIKKYPDTIRQQMESLKEEGEIKYHITKPRHHYAIGFNSIDNAVEAAKLFYDHKVKK